LEIVIDEEVDPSVPLPTAPAGSEPMEQHDGLALAIDLVMQFDAVSGEHWHVSGD
jgi:hypothetical protein